MDDNEYFIQYLVRERLREAEARWAYRAMLQEARRGTVSRDSTRPGRSGLRWLASVAWVAHLSLPKICNRL
jgi:hypothetical protein